MQLYNNVDFITRNTSDIDHSPRSPKYMTLCLRKTRLLDRMKFSRASLELSISCGNVLSSAWRPINQHDLKS